MTGSCCGEITFETCDHPVDQVAVHCAIDHFDIVALGFAQEEINPVGSIDTAVKIPKTVRQNKDFPGAAQFGLLCRLK